MSRIDPEFAQKLRTDLGDGLDVTVDLHIRLHRNGAMSVSAPIGDKVLCFQMLDHARDAIKRQGRERPGIIVPGKDVAVTQ